MLARIRASNLRQIEMANAKREEPTPMPCTKRSMARLVIQLGVLLFVSVAIAAAQASSTGLENIFKPESTPAKSIFDLSVFVLVITGIILVVVFILLVYSISKFRATAANA